VRAKTEAGDIGPTERKLEILAAVLMALLAAFLASP
jgi:hypothetical protein